VTQDYFVRELDNGLILLAERLDHVASTSVQLSLPVGASRDTNALSGAANVLAEWLFRGAAGRDSRQLHDAFDALGCQHDQSVQSAFLQLSSSQAHQNLRDTLTLYADIVREPALAGDTFGPCRDLALQELASLEDQPTRKCTARLRERFYPAPLGSPAVGRNESLSAMTDDRLRAHARKHLTPRGAILAVAGHVRFDPLCDWATELFGGWTGDPLPAAESSEPVGGVDHEAKQTAQVQISLAYKAPDITDKHYYPMRLAEMVLSGGMSGRLFTEVREKRGLVYSVGARYQAVKGAAGLFIYAGTAGERAQETLEVTTRELRKLSDGITDDELTRAKTQLKAALIMQGESTRSRAVGLTNDWHLLGRLRQLDEIASAIEAVTLDAVAACVAAYPAANLTGYIIGPEPLDVSCLA